MSTKDDAIKLNKANPQRTKDEQLVEISITTLLSVRTEEGVVQFSIKNGEDHIITQWDIRKAREIRDMIGEAIEAAASDWMIYKFFIEKVRLDKERAAAIVQDFRELRHGTKLAGDHH